MSSAAIEESGVGAGGSAPERLRVLFFLPDIGYFRVFESLLGAMLAAGHRIVVALDHQGAGLVQGQARVLDQLRQQHSDFSYTQLPRRKGLWLIPASAIRRRLDYLSYLEPGHPDPDATPTPTWGLKALLFLPPFRWQFGRRLLVRLLRRLEAGMPISRTPRSFVSERAPDVVVVTPLVEFGSPQADDLRAAQAARIPTVFVVASEDDLTSKGGVRDVPTSIIAWDDAQVDAAVSLHGLPRERIAAVGAQSQNGGQAPATPGAVEAIERAASTEVAPRREGRFLRPLLWLLTPLLAIVLPLVRPRATARSVAAAVRKRAKTLRRTAKTRRKARAQAAKEQKMAEAEAATEQKKARAEAKEQRMAEAEAATEQKKARAEAKEQKLARARAAEQKMMAETEQQRENGPAEAAKETEEAAKETEESRG